MSYPSANQGYYTAAYEAPAEDDATSLLPRYMAVAVLVLGLASYLMSFGPMPDALTGGWGVRFAVLAALFAGFGLIPRQKLAFKVIAALAVAGFLDALASLVGASGGGWALTVIVVLNGLQSLAAIGGLLQADPAEEPESGSYEAYAEYWSQLAQYYGQYPQVAEDRGEVQRAGQGQAQADAQASAQVAARAPRTVADQSAGYAELVANQDPERTAIIDRIPAEPEHRAQSGLPSFGQASGQAPGNPSSAQGESQARPSAP